MIKDRQTMYAVIRKGDNDVLPVGAWSTLERAEEMQGCYEQELKDRGIEDFSFEVIALTVYDE